MYSIISIHRAGDHPRMRGEHLATQFEQWHTTGSSPHARGTLIVRTISLVYAGIIPACAGNTKHVIAKRQLHGDHPRMRGEHGSRWRSNRLFRGSSPHARGTPLVIRLSCESLGIIPACAGNTSSSTLISERKRDHPRMRGEHLIEGLTQAIPQGSSPHARGTPITLCWTI